MAIVNVEFLEAAQVELDEAFSWYETQQAHLGWQFLLEFDAAVQRICAYPEAFAFFEGEIRRCFMKRFPYAILYGINADAVIIVAVAHLHRKPGYWLTRVDP